VLFAGWTSSAHSAYHGYEFGQGSKPIYHVIPYPYFADPDGVIPPYQPLHYKKLISDGTRNGSVGSTSAAGTGFEAAFEANTTMLAIGSLHTGSSSFGLMAGTSPSIAGVEGGYQVAFQANTGNLWTAGALGTRDWGLAMMAGTSPSITAVAGGFEVAFQANTGVLRTVGALGNRNWGLSLNHASNPSIAAVTGSFQVAFEANTDELWVVNPSEAATRVLA
jgi:hypothetical protein